MYIYIDPNVYTPHQGLYIYIAACGREKARYWSPWARALLTPLMIGCQFDILQVWWWGHHGVEWSSNERVTLG